MVTYWVICLAILIYFHKKSQLLLTNINYLNIKLVVVFRFMLGTTNHFKKMQHIFCFVTFYSLVQTLTFTMVSTMKKTSLRGCECELSIHYTSIFCLLSSILSLPPAAYSPFSLSLVLSHFLSLSNLPRCRESCSRLNLVVALASLPGKKKTIWFF